MDLDEIVAFATGLGSSTHHTQSPKTRLNPTKPQPQPNQPPHTRLHVTQPPVPTTSYSHPHQNIPSIHRRLHAYTFKCKQIVNFIYLLYITIDILTFMWYNQDNGKGAFS